MRRIRAGAFVTLTGSASDAAAATAHWRRSEKEEEKEPEVVTYFDWDMGQVKNYYFFYKIGESHCNY